jgi:hypothetical protein
VPRAAGGAGPSARRPTRASRSAIRDASSWWAIVCHSSTRSCRNKLRVARWPFPRWEDRPLLPPHHGTPTPARRPVRSRRLARPSTALRVSSRGRPIAPRCRYQEAGEPGFDHEQLDAVEPGSSISANNSSRQMDRGGNSSPTGQRNARWGPCRWQPRTRQVRGTGRSEPGIVSVISTRCRSSGSNSSVLTASRLSSVG